MKISLFIVLRFVSHATKSGSANTGIFRSVSLRATVSEAPISRDENTHCPVYYRSYSDVVSDCWGLPPIKCGRSYEYVATDRGSPRGYNPAMQPRCFQWSRRAELRTPPWIDCTSAQTPRSGPSQIDPASSVDYSRVNKLFQLFQQLVALHESVGLVWFFGAWNVAIAMTDCLFVAVQRQGI
jgi:hypothetical protein